MDDYKKDGLLEKIRRNCEYLTNIRHIKQISPLRKYTQPKNNEVCPESIAKSITQLTYLLYASSIVSADIYISNKFVFRKRRNQPNFEAQLVFYLAAELYEINQIQQITKQCDFGLVRPHKFNSVVLQVIQKLLRQTKDLMFESPSFGLAKLIILNFQKCIKKHIQPKLLNDPQFAVIKHLQKTKLFSKYSDLFHIYKSSMFYKIKKKTQVLQTLKSEKNNLNMLIIDYIRNNNTNAFYHILDEFLNFLTSKDIIYQEKSSTNLRNFNKYIVGSLLPFDANQKNVLKYQARFYTLNTSFSQSSKQGDEEKEVKDIEKNIYIIEYSVEKLTMEVAYVTILQVTNQNLDFITSHCSNILFQATKIIIDTLQIPVYTNSSNTIKKYIIFKASFRMLKIEEPLSKFLILIEYVTICGRIFLELMMKKPQKDQFFVIKQYQQRVDHLNQIFVEKAKQFYQSL